MGCYYTGTSCNLCCLVATSIVMTVVVIVVVPVTLRCTAPGYLNGEQSYGPTDTVILPPINTIFCQGLKVTSTYVLYSNLTLYMLDSPPKLIGRETFAFSDTHSFSDQPFWQDGGVNYHYCYYMHPGSNFTVSACILNGEEDSSSTFYVFKDKSSVDELVIDEACSTGQNFSYVHQIEDEGDYCLVFYVERTHVDENAVLGLHATFNRTRYEVTGDVSVLQSCFMADSDPSCSVGVALSGDHTPFLSLAADKSRVSWKDDGVDLNFACVPRMWIYATISVAILVVLIVTIIVMACVFAMKYCECTIEDTPLLHSNKRPAKKYTFILFIYYYVVRYRVVKKTEVNADDDENVQVKVSF